MSKLLLINNANAVPTANANHKSPTDVAEGRIAAFNADYFAGGTLDLTAASTAAANNPNSDYPLNRVVFVQGGASGENPIMSPAFSISDIKAGQVKVAPYTAATLQQTSVTVNVTNEQTGVATLRVVRVDTGFMPHERVTVETTLDNRSGTDAQIAEAVAADLVTAINNSSQTFVSATSTGAVITLTGAAGVSFETSLDDYTNDWTIASVASPELGTGSSEHVSNLEQIAYGGNYTNRIYLPVTPPSYVVAGETYDLFTVLVPTNTTPNISSSNRYLELILAVQATASAIDLPTFFGV